MSHKVRRRGAALSSSAMDDFAVGDHVVLSKGLPGRNDNVGIVVEVGDDVVWVKWKGPDVPEKPAKYVPRTLERA
jgi:co-chaperonin GroES (HSP10)